jgi:hypothetical protein
VAKSHKGMPLFLWLIVLMLKLSAPLTDPIVSGLVLFPDFFEIHLLHGNFFALHLVNIAAFLYITTAWPFEGENKFISNEFYLKTKS